MCAPRGQASRALLWLRYQDSNECGLLETHEAMDWADLVAHHYNTLNANVLYCAALKGVGELAGAIGERNADYTAQAADVRFKINLLLRRQTGRDEHKNGSSTSGCTDRAAGRWASRISLGRRRCTSTPMNA